MNLNNTNNEQNIQLKEIIVENKSLKKQNLEFSTLKISLSSPEDILETLLKKYVQNQVYVSWLDTIAGEHAARMTSMDAATKNAGEMIDKLQLHYNRSRQAAITSELIEIISGAESL